MTKRIGYVCSFCGSNAVLMDAWAKWDTETQEWVLHDTMVETYCRECDGDARLTEVELANA